MIASPVISPADVISPVDPSIDALHTLVARLAILSPTPSAVLIPTPAVAFKLIA